MLAILETMKAKLCTFTHIRIEFKDGPAIYPKSFIQACLDELEGKLKASVAGLHEITPLERLAIELLMSSAEITGDRSGTTTNLT